MTIRLFLNSPKRKEIEKISTAKQILLREIKTSQANDKAQKSLVSAFDSFALRGNGQTMVIVTLEFVDETNISVSSNRDILTEISLVLSFKSFPKSVFCGGQRGVFITHTTSQI